MIYKKRKFFLNSIRVLHQNEDLGELLDKTKYDYMTVISYRDLGLEKQGFGLIKKKLANIRLNGSLEEITAKFARRTQQEIMKTFKITELKFTVGDTDFHGTYALYRDFELAQGRKPWSRESLAGLMNFNAYYKGELIVAVPCYDLYPYLQVRAIFSKRLSIGDDNKDLYKIIGSATRRLIFEICKYGKENDYEYVGLGSVNYSTAQKSNVAQFKMFFGSEIGDEYTYTHKSRKFLFLEKIRSAIKKILWF